MGGTATQHSMFGDSVTVPMITGTFAQVKYLLETQPQLRGRVGAVVAEVWREFHGLDHKIRAGDVTGVMAVISGQAKGVPNYKTVSRNYHRVCEQFPDLYKEPPEEDDAKATT